MATDGLTTLPSSFGPQDTVTRLEAAVKARGMAVFARVDHAAGAAEVGLALPLMQSDQTLGIDVPLKALVWQAAAGKTWLSYNDPGGLVKRHGMGAEGAITVAMLADALSAVARAATNST